MYQIGDTVIYNNVGVCKITGITKPDFITGNENRLYYVMESSYKEGIIYTPIDTKVFMRYIITAMEAEQLIDMMPTIQAEAYHNNSAQLLTAHYEKAIQSHECADLIGLTKSIYAKKLDLEKLNRKSGQIDERYMSQAEDLLFGELAAAIGIPRDSIKNYIAKRIEDTSEKLL